jgi:hypothetical protein
VGAPLRPTEQDLAFIRDAIDGFARSRRTMRALILGVTQELFHLLDGARTDLLAIDHTQGMIDQVWPGPRSRVVRADWTALPIAPRCRDLALCDFCSIIGKSSARKSWECSIRSRLGNSI